MHSYELNFFINKTETNDRKYAERSCAIARHISV
jgi:hypothetical protein